LGALPQAIEALEREQEELTQRMSTPDYYRKAGDQIRTDQLRMQELESQLRDKFKRWEALEGQRKI
jgi:ATP-binding cassette subfamily F protein uup